MREVAYTVKLRSRDGETILRAIAAQVPLIAQEIGQADWQPDTGTEYPFDWTRKELTKDGASRRSEKLDLADKAIFAIGFVLGVDLSVPQPKAPYEPPVKSEPERYPPLQNHQKLSVHAFASANSMELVIRASGTQANILARRLAAYVERTYPVKP